MYAMGQTGAKLRSGHSARLLPDGNEIMGRLTP